MMTTLSLQEARRLLLLRQGLLQKSPFAKGEAGITATVKRLGYVQLDTISVVARAHHHILWNRVPAYDRLQFDRAYQEEASIFEYWGHAAAFLPTESYRFSLPRKSMLQTGKKHWFERDLKLMEQLLETIKREGPKQSRDFKAPAGTQHGPWYDWKPSKKALEQLFMEGQLMIRGRQGFQKIYDLPERVLPTDTPTQMPSTLEWGQHLILRSIDAFGLARTKHMHYHQGFAKKAVETGIEHLLETGDIIPLTLEKFSGHIWYTRPAFLETSFRLSKKRLHLLSPFDPVVIMRERLWDLFHFSYRLECYVPQGKREYGYFTMPILWGDHFIGRLDAKADRKRKVFQVHNIWLETPRTDGWIEALAQQLISYANFAGAPKIEIAMCESAEVKEALLRFIAASG